MSVPRTFLPLGFWLLLTSPILTSCRSCWVRDFLCTAPAPSENPTSGGTALPAPSPTNVPAAPTPLGDRLPLTTVGAPGPRQGHLSLAVGGRLFVVAGENTETDLGDGDIYDPAANSWKALNLPAPLSPRFLTAGAAGTVGGMPVALLWGGSQFVQITQSRGNRLGDGAVYFPDTGTWNVMAVGLGTPSIRSGHCAVFGDGQFIVWGGENQGTDFADGGIYDPNADVWQAIPPSNVGSFLGPSARERHACFWDDGKKRMLLYGGFQGSSFDDLWALYPGTMTWENQSVTGEPLLPRLDPTVGFGGGFLLVYGGSVEAARKDGVLINLATMEALPLSAAGGPDRTAADDRLAAWDGGGFVIAGENATSGDYQAWRLRIDSVSGGVAQATWQLLSDAAAPDSDSPNVGLSVVSTGTYLLLWGGRNHDATLNNNGIRFLLP